MCSCFTVNLSVACLPLHVWQSHLQRCFLIDLKHASITRSGNISSSAEVHTVWKRQGWFLLLFSDLSLQRVYVFTLTQGHKAVLSVSTQFMLHRLSKPLCAKLFILLENWEAQRENTKSANVYGLIRIQTITCDGNIGSENCALMLFCLYSGLTRNE